MAISTTALNAYVNEHSEPIIKSTLFGAPSIDLMSVMTDVKNDTALNILETTVSFGDGKTCGWADNSSSSLTQRTLKPAALKLNLGYCQRSLIKYWAGVDCNIKAGVETLPFEEKFVNDAVTSVNEALDNMIWYGDSSNGTVATQFDGVWTVLNANDVSTVVTKVTGTSALDASLYTKLGSVIESIPSAVFNDNIVVMSVSTFRGVIKDFEATHPYKSLEMSDDKLSFVYPNTNVRVYGVIGMETTTAANKKDMISFNPKHMFYGVDFEDASSTFKFFFSEREQEFDLVMEMNAGVQVAFPDECVIATTYTA